MHLLILKDIESEILAKLELSDTSVIIESSKSDILTDLEISINALSVTLPFWAHSKKSKTLDNIGTLSNMLREVRTNLKRSDLAPIERIEAALRVFGR